LSPSQADVQFTGHLLWEKDFVHDLLAGDIVVRTTDASNGVGQGPANYLWTSPDEALLAISGGVWLGRGIDRSVQWALVKNGVPLTVGDLASGDVYSRANPFDSSDGSDGASAITDIPVSVGDQIMLLFTATSTAGGDFVGVDLAIEATVPELSTLTILSVAGLALLRRRRTCQEGAPICQAFQN
jgi:hypothetical protein